MKHIFTILALFFVTTALWGQSPEKMSYQAVIRNTENNLVTSSLVGMQVSIIQGSSSGNVVYAETHTLSTNANGLVSFEVGTGTTLNDFSTVDWSNGPFFIKTETDPTGGNNYTISGTNQLMSVPYALYAKTSGSSIPGPIGPAGPQGPAGINGTDGATGPQGEQGIAGPTGATGPAGPTGPAGAQGPPGNDGVDGLNGQDGADGLSAYDVWTNLGNTGTEEDFIDSLVGPQGEQGTGQDGFKLINTFFDQNISIAPDANITSTIQAINTNHIIIKFTPRYDSYNNIALSIACYDSNNNLLELYTEELIYRRDRLHSSRVDFTKIETNYFNTTTFNRSYSSVTGSNGTVGEAIGDIKIWSNGNIDHIEYTIQNTNSNSNFSNTRTPTLKIFTYN